MLSSFRIPTTRVYQQYQVEVSIGYRQEEVTFYSFPYDVIFLNNA